MFFSDFSALVRAAFSGLISLFTDERTGPFLAGVLIILGLCVLAYVVATWLMNSATLARASSVLKVASGQNEADKKSAFVEQYGTIDQKLFAIGRMQHAWREFRETLIFPDPESSRTGVGIISNSSRPQTFFNPSALHMGFSFLKHVPNVFVGVGLLGTFIGLIAALTAALGTLGVGGPEGAQDAIHKLLTTASAKFYVSAAALAVSIILGLVIRGCASGVAKSISAFNDCLEERLSFATAEGIAGQQLAAIREQTRQLQTFNTDLAMTIGQSVREAVSASNGALVQQLEGIAATFSKLVEASRQGAGEAISKVVDDTLTTTLRETTSTIKTIADALTNLPARLEMAANALQQAGSTAQVAQASITSKLQAQARDAMLDTTNAMAEQIKVGTGQMVSQLSETGLAFANGAARVDAILSQFSDSGSELATTLATLSRESASLQSQVVGTAQALAQSADDLRTATSGIGQQISAVLVAVRELADASRAASTSAQSAQAAIATNLQTLTDQWQRHVGRFDGVDEKLAETFGAISDQITLQTQQMQQQVGLTDSALARAVTTLEALVESLADERTSGS